MGLLQRVQNFVFKGFSQEEIITKGWEELRSQTVSQVSNANPGTLAPTVTTIQSINKYRSWIYDVVTLIKNKVATVPYYLYQEVGQPNDEEYNRILVHPIISLLKKPNKYQSGRRLKEIIQMHLDLAGFAVVRILKNGAGQPAELHVLNPHELVNIELGNNTNEVIKSFTFSPQFNRFLREKISYEDVLYFHYPHPSNSHLPCSPIQAIAHQSDLDLYLQVYEKDFFQNNARPDFLITPKGNIAPDQAKRIQEGWMSRFRGPGKQHKPAVMSGDVDVKQLGMSARDFEFMALSEWTKDHILAAYQTPESMLGLFESFNKASSISAQTIWVEGCIEPRLAVFEDTINNQLLPLFRSTKGLEFKHDSALPKDDEWDLAKNQGELTMGLTTVNDIRKKRGEKPFKTALLDVPWMNGMPIPGISEEADKLFEKMSMGGAAPTGGMPPGMGGQLPPELMGGMPPGMPGIPPEASSIPSAQGPAGVLGGRPTGTQLSSLLNEALRSSKPTLSMLLNAARGKRGGLSSLMQAHPLIGDFASSLAAERNSPKLAQLFTRGIYEYIEKDLDEQDRIVFKIYEEMLPKLDYVESEYETEAGDFFIKKGIEIANITKKMLNNYTTKDIEEDIDIERLKEDYKKSAELYIKKATEIGYLTGFEIVRKAGASDLRGADVYEKASLDAAGRFLERSAELKVDSTRKALVKTIQDGIKQGLGSDQVAEMIQDEFTNIGTYRANMIARTELAGAIDIGLDASFEQINKEAGQAIVKKATHWNALDERVCKRPNGGCKAKHGALMKNYETGEVFMESSVVHPNCRCIRRPELK